MNHGTTTLCGRFHVPSSRASRVFRRLAWAAGLAVLALVLAAAPDLAWAQIHFTDTAATAPWSLGANVNPDQYFTTPESFTVTSGSDNSVLVVQLDEYSQYNSTSGSSANPTITWTPSGGTATPVPMIEREISSSTTYVYADIFALKNPAGGTGTLTISGSFRAAYADAFTLSGVSTAVSAGTYGSQANAATTAVSLSNTTAANSFAVTAQGDRLGTLGFLMTPTSGSPQIQWTNTDATGNFNSGGGYVANLAAGATTITNSANTTSRNTFGVAVFTPLVAPAGAMVWGGTGASGNWDVDTTKNWQTPSTLSYYIEPNNGVLFNDSAGTLGGTTNVVVAQVVSPKSVTFNNNTYPYTFTASGAGAISGSGAVTLSGGGLVNMNLANTYSGGTTVSAGTLAIGNASGSATGTGPVAIAAGATLSGNGFMSPSGANAVSVSGSITPDPSPNINSFNTLTASALSLNSGSTLNLNFQTTLPGQHDLINVTGALTLGSGTININAANLTGTWSPGAYTFANYNTLTNGNPTFNLVNTEGTLGTSVMSIDESVNHVISIDVLSAASSRTVSWVGNVNSGGSYLWDIANTLNWTSSGGASAYNEGNRVVFSNTASNFVVTVNQQVNPSSVTFSNSSNSYTLTGSGGIQTTTLGVAVNGGGTVILNNNNDYTSVTMVTNGSTLIVNGSLPNSNVIVTGASVGGNGQLAASPVSLTLNGATALTAGSDLTVNGPANVVTGTFTIPASATLSGSGGINVSSGAQLALSGIVDVNQVVNVNGVLSGNGTVNGGVNLSSGTLSPVGTLTLNGAVTNSGTSSITSGIISAGGPWTGSGAVNVPSGSDLLLGGGASIAGVTLNVSGTLDGTSGATVNSAVNVLGSGSASINSGTVPSLGASGGTTNLTGATVNVATVSGSNAVVNVTAGTVPILNVVNSNLTSGVTVFPGASACTTSASVSGGLVTLENIDIIPTAVLSGGTTNWAGPTGNTATVSGSNTVVNITAGRVLNLNVVNSSLIGGVTGGAGETVGSVSLSVSGGLVNLNNSNTIPVATLSGGTTNLNGPTVTVATVSGTNTVVNVTAGAVPTLNVTNSSLIGGVTVSSSASACSTALTVSGGLVNLYNSDTIPTAALSGGTTNLSGPTVTTANVSGGAVVNVNQGSLTTLNASGTATTTVSSSATVTNANVYGGLANLNPTSGLSSLLLAGGRVNVSSSSALALLAVTGGTANLPGGTTTVATVNFAAGAAAFVTPNPLVVSNQLTFNGGASAAVSGGTFGYATSGGNLANTSAPGTLTLAGVLTFSPSLSAGTSINVDTAQTANTGTGPSPDMGTYWNVPAANATGVALLNSASSATTVTYTQAGQNGTFGTGNPNGVLSKFSYNNAANGTENFTFGGLTPGAEYNLYAIMCNNTGGGRASTFTTGGSSQTIANPANYATVSITSTSVYCEFPTLIANASGQINVLVSTPATNGEDNINGFQLVPLNVPSGSVNLPSTGIVAAANSTLDFSGAGPANALAGLSLAGNMTVQNVASGGSVQLNGDVVASANATVSLASGAGSVPVLVLSGNTSGIQNISAVNGATLTLPAAAISAPTVKFNASGGTGSVVVLSGATSLTYASGAAATVNAGTLKVSSTLSGAAGAS